MGTKTSNYQVGISATNTQNFNIRTGLDGTLRIFRGGDTSEVGEVFQITPSGDIILSGNITSGALGTNQTWQNVSASRASGVTYTNTTGKPIEVSIYAGTSIGSIVVDGVTIMSVVGNELASSFIVPIGATYSITYTGTAFWAELR